MVSMTSGSTATAMPVMGASLHTVLDPDRVAELLPQGA